MSRKVKIVAWGDLQAHPWQEGEREDRVGDCLEAVEKIYVIAETETADAVVFLGDLFENKRAARNDVMSRIYSRLRDGPWAAPHIFLPGNHDQYRGENLLLLLRGETYRGTENQVIVASGLFPVAGIPCYFVPYGMKPELGASWAVAFTHADVRGARLQEASDLRCRDDGLPAEFLRAEGERRMIFNGHYHSRQIILRRGCVPIVCVGAPLCHDWSDRDAKVSRGCEVIEATGAEDSWEVKSRHVPFDQFPRFLSSSEGARDGVDFVAPQVEAVPIVVGRVHEDAEEVVGGETVGDVLAGYVGAKRRDLKEGDRRRLVEAGLRFLEE